MTRHLRQYIETEILPYAGKVKSGKRFAKIPSFIKWVKANLFLHGNISQQSLMDYLLLQKQFINKRRNIYLSYKKFDALPLELQGTEQHGNFHKVLLTVLILPCDWVDDGHFWFLTDDEFMIMGANL